MLDRPDSHSVIPTEGDGASTELDAAGQTILKLLHKAAGVAEANSKQALEMAQKLSHQLRAAENRIGELEAEVQLYREKAEHAEQWLHKISTEIEERLIRQPEEILESITRGSPRRSRTAKASRISRCAVKLRCACEWGG